eukprot:TRINITY_DN21099_c0_g2_i1.p1 TRINITY_DN21099_c0_g2~~TRINITY_DN21099_c0_g2_i1.p1  ORF type:complete len:356 (-),score=49.96 TRINITY_DN21099_c0_g2_i1:188-1255(-)
MRVASNMAPLRLPIRGHVAIFVCCLMLVVDVIADVGEDHIVRKHHSLARKSGDEAAEHAHAEEVHQQIEEHHEYVNKHEKLEHGDTNEHPHEHENELDNEHEHEHEGSHEDEQEVVIDPDLANLTPEKMQQLHKAMDTDGNGFCSVKEVFAFARKCRRASSLADIISGLGSIDKNKDGKLSREEVIPNFSEQNEDEAHKAFFAHQLQKFQLADADGDGFLAGDELMSYYLPDETNPDIVKLLSARTMKKKDLDQNGWLTAWEFFREEGQDFDLFEHEKEVFRGLDKDNDGLLSAEELHVWESGTHHLSTSIDRVMAATDADKDNHLSPDEFHSALKFDTGEAQYLFMEWAKHGEL